LVLLWSCAEVEAVGGSCGRDEDRSTGFSGAPLKALTPELALPCGDNSVNEEESWKDNHAA
jgi:hypothetical protein